MNYKLTSDIQESQHKQILDLIHASFEEHERNELHFTCTKYSLQDVKNKVLRGRAIIAVDDDNEVVGITSFSKVNDGVCYEDITAISPKTKGMGVGTALYEARKKELLKLGAKCLISDTAVGATSSVNWHLRKCHCHIIGLESFASTNYYSYVFREDITPRCFIYPMIIYPMQYGMSYLFCKSVKHADGTFTWLGNILNKIRKTLRK